MKKGFFFHSFLDLSDLNILLLRDIFWNFLKVLKKFFILPLGDLQPTFKKSKPRKHYDSLVFADSMFENNSDEDFDFDLDEVSKSKKTNLLY